MTDPRRDLPSVSALLAQAEVQSLLGRAPRNVVADAVRDAIADARRNPAAVPGDREAWGAAVGAALDARERRSLRPVLNATGVVLHTNLGRAPLPRAALEAIVAVATGHANLEYDLERGVRGSRTVHCVSLLRELTGAEDAMVVNNGAAALLLALNTVADARRAIVSRGELVEIGGSFRVPAIMAKSGVELVEVGTTNRTHAADYAAVLGPEIGAVVKVHRSNFTVSGFVAEVPVSELVALCRPLGIPVIHDLGSGLLMPLDAFGLSGEPVAREAVAAGATLVTMSGDKLLGGPQAGILLGSAGAIARARANPLARSLRVDKLTLAALEATLALYRDPPLAMREIPTLAMLTMPVDLLRERAGRIRDALSAAGVAADVVASTATVGGGAFPAAELPSAAIALGGDGEGHRPAAELERRLRAGTPPVIGRLLDGRLLLDLRSLPAEADAALRDAILAGHA